MIILENCPFCGGEARLRQMTSGFRTGRAMITNSYVAGCDECRIWTSSCESEIWQDDKGQIHVDKNGAEDAARAWNKRVHDEGGDTA